MLLTDGSSNRAHAQEKRYGLVSAGVSRLVVNRADFGSPSYLCRSGFDAVLPTASVSGRCAARDRCT